MGHINILAVGNEGGGVVLIFVKFC